MFRKGAVIFLFASALMSCGPERDAKEVCACYTEVYRSADEEADEKMKECLKLLDKYLKKYEGTNQYADFQDAYEHCR